MGNGAYGTVGAYKKCHERKIDLVAKPKTSDVVDEEATEAHILARNKQVAYFQENGIYAWCGVTIKTRLLGSEISIIQV